MARSITDITNKINLIVYSYATGTAADNGDNTLIAAPGAGMRLVIRELMVENESGSETTIIIKNGATAIKRRMTTAKGHGYGRAYPPGGELRLAENSALVANLSGANTIGWHAEYITERTV